MIKIKFINKFFLTILILNINILKIFPFQSDYNKNEILNISPLSELYLKDIESNKDDKIFSKTIIIKNLSNISIFAATYYKKNFVGFGCQIESDIFEIAPKSKFSIKRPSYSIIWKRKLIVSKKKSELKKTFTRKEYKLSSRVTISEEKGDKYYIFLKYNVIKCYNLIQWHIIKPILDIFKKITDPIIDKIIKLISKHKYIKAEAKVRVGNNLCKQEKDFIYYRKKIVKNNLEKLLGIQIKNYAVPNIALCFSGGGYRAMISTLGSLLGAQQIEILDSVTYMASLSGSTWLLGPWSTYGIPIDKYKDILEKNIDLNIFEKDIHLPLLVETLIQKSLFKQDLSIIDIYGSLLANSLLQNFGMKRQKMHLSDVSKLIEKGKFPIPIYTATEATTNDYEWFEFTPFEVGSTFLKSFIPTWAFGRTFVNGKSKNFAPEQSLGFMMGIWGSACSANFEEIYRELKNKLRRILPFGLINFAVNQTSIGDIRFSPAHAFNFTYGMYNSPMRNINELTLVDAGIHFNLPFPPLLRPERKIDIIIVCDYSARNGEISGSLKKAEEYALSRGLKFPKIDYSSINENIISVFKDKNDINTPVIIYLPLIKNNKYSYSFDPHNSSFCNTFNFIYSKNQFNLLYGLTKFNMLESKEKIIQTIREVVERKNY